MRPLAAVPIVLCLLLVSCGAGEEATGGIEGRVLAGPTCPVETEGSPCPPSPWEGTVRATRADGSTIETTSDTEGRYSLRLPPGTYVVTAVTETSSLPTAVPAEVTVDEGPPQVLDLEVDTGIR